MHDARWLHDSPQIIIMPGEANTSAENSGKPLGSGSAPNPVGGAHSVRPDPLDGGEGACCPSPHPKNPSPRSCSRPRFSALRPPDEKSWARPWNEDGIGLHGVYLQGADERMRVGVAQQQCQLLAGERLGGIVIRRRRRRLPRQLSDELIRRHTGPPAVAEIRSRTAFTRSASELSAGYWGGVYI